MNKKLQEGLVLLFWLLSSFVLGLIFFFVFLIWNTKIALFIASVLGLIFVFWIIVSLLWVKQLKKD